MRPACGGRLYRGAGVAAAVLAAAVTVLAVALAAGALLAGAATPGAPALVAIQQAQLPDWQPAAYARLGSAVALDGDTLLVAARDESVGGQPYAGSVYVFVRSAGAWTQQGVLTAPSPVAGDGFGASVALDGDTALVGADNRAAAGRSHSGAAYVFTRSGGAWSLQAELVAGDAAANDWAGSAVALDGGTALVGAPGRTVDGRSYAGAAFVFSSYGGQWVQQAMLTAADGAAGDEFGRAVALDGGTALVGAENRTSGAVREAGAAYVFTGAGAGWSQQAVLQAPDPTQRAGFGTALALSGGTALVGAGGATIAGQTNAGAAYVYTGSGGSWPLQAELTGPGTFPGGWFGCAVALAGERAVIGAWGQTVGGRLEAGAAYVFDRTGAAWSQVAVDTAQSAADGDTLGWSVAAAGDTVVAGAPGRGVGGRPVCGAAFVHKLLPAPSLSIAASPAAVKTGRAVLLSGTVANAVSGPVKIWRRQGTKLTQLGSATVSSSGGYSWQVRPKTRGTWVFVATYQAGGQTFRSPEASVKVTVPTKPKKPANPHH